MKTFTVKDFAKDFRLSEKVARRRIYRLIENGDVKQTSSGSYPVKYVEKLKINWHDPFNKCKRGNHEEIISGLIADCFKRSSPILKRK